MENMQDLLPVVGEKVYKIECYLGSHIVVDDNRIKGAIKGGWVFNEEEAPAMFTAIGVNREGMENTNRYTFVCEHNNFMAGDVVLVDTKYGFTMGKVCYVASEPSRLESSEGFRRVLGKITCLDEAVMKAYRRIETEMMLETLREMKTKFDERMMFQMLAQSSPEAAALLDELKKRGAM